MWIAEDCILCLDSRRRLTERPIVLVLKTRGGETRPRVRIPHLLPSMEFEEEVVDSLACEAGESQCKSGRTPQVIIGVGVMAARVVLVH